VTQLRVVADADGDPQAQLGDRLQIEEQRAGGEKAEVGGIARESVRSSAQAWMASASEASRPSGTSSRMRPSAVTTRWWVGLSSRMQVPAARVGTAGTSGAGSSRTTTAGATGTGTTGATGTASATIGGDGAGGLGAHVPASRARARARGGMGVLGDRSARSDWNVRWAARVDRRRPASPACSWWGGRTTPRGTEDPCYQGRHGPSTLRQDRPGTRRRQRDRRRPQRGHDPGRR
jgi:hypothetical protein